MQCAEGGPQRAPVSGDGQALAALWRNVDLEGAELGLRLEGNVGWGQLSSPGDEAAPDGSQDGQRGWGTALRSGEGAGSSLTGREHRPPPRGRNHGGKLPSVKKGPRRCCTRAAPFAPPLGFPCAAGGKAHRQDRRARSGADPDGSRPGEAGLTAPSPLLPLQSLRCSRGLGSGRKGSKTRTARLVGADMHPEAAAGAGHPGTRDSPDPRSWSAFGRKPQI